MREYKYKVFTAKIEALITAGVLQPGAKLPSIRTIKKEYNLSTSSVQNGYDYLIFKGVVRSIPQSGYVVANTVNLKDIEQKITLSLEVIDSTFKKKLRAISLPSHSEHAMAFNAAEPSASFVPDKLVLRTMQQVIRKKNTELLRYYPTNGSEELRALLCKRAATYGALIQSEELIITDGALQALYIALAVTTQPHDIIAVESPCVFSMLEVIANLKLKVIEIPIRRNEGMDLADLKNCCEKQNIKAIVLTPNFHNPTGVLMPDERKQALLQFALFRNIPLIENDIYGDLYFAHTRPTTIRNFDDSGLVLTISSFAKTIAPGIRLGWLAAGRFAKQAEQLKFALGRSVSPLYQEVMIQLLRTSSYEKHIRRYRANLERQSLEFTQLFTTVFPEITPIQTPQGGYSLWNKLPPTIDGQEFEKIAHQCGIYFTPGSTFSFTNVYDSYFRSVFANKLTETSIHAIHQLATHFRH